MSIKNIKLGNIEIPIKENVDIVGYQRDNYAYLPDGVSLNNESSMKLKYDPLSNSIEIGHIKSVTYDAKGNPENSSTFLGKIKLFGSGSEEDVTSPELISEELQKHIKNEAIHLDNEERRSLTSFEGFFDLMSIGFDGEDEKISFGPILNGSEEQSFRAFFVEPLSALEFNTFKIKMPKSSQDSIENVYAMVYLIKKGESTQSESGRLMGYSTNGVHVYSTKTSEGYFEWNFEKTILVDKKEQMVIKFFTSKNFEDNDYYIKSRIKYLESFDDPQCFLKTNNGISYYAAPECVFSLKKPKYLYFK